MTIPGDDGTTKISHLRQAAKTGVVPPELEEPYFPEQVRYIFDFWKRIYRERDSSISVQALRSRDIMDWAKAHRVDFMPFEIELLIDIDREYVSASRGHSKPTDQSRG